MPKSRNQLPYPGTGGLCPGSSERERVDPRYQSSTRSRSLLQEWSGLPAVMARQWNRNWLIREIRAIRG